MGSCLVGSPYLLLEEDDDTPATCGSFPVKPLNRVVCFKLAVEEGFGIGGLLQTLSAVVDTDEAVDLLRVFPQTPVAAEGDCDRTKDGCPGEFEIDLLTSLNRGFSEG